MRKLLSLDEYRLIENYRALKPQSKIKVIRLIRLRRFIWRK